MGRQEKNKKYILEIITLFVKKEKQARFCEFAGSRRKYGQFLDELFIDPRNLKPNCLTELTGRDRSPEAVAKRLTGLAPGSGGYVLSEVDELDGRFGNLREILDTVIDSRVGCIVYCVGGRLAYYEDSEDFRYILDCRN